MKYEITKNRKKANKFLFEYYKEKLKEKEVKRKLKKNKRKRLLWICDTGILENKKLPLDKTSRWIGYIQGILIENGILSIDKERDFTRPIFHKAYFKDNIKTPKKKTFKK